MDPDQRDLIHRQDLLGPSRPPHHDASLLEAGSVAHLLESAEKEHLRGHVGLEAERLRIVPVQDGPVQRALVFKNPAFGQAVCRVMGVPVLVVRRHVEEDRHVRPKGFDPFQLEGGKLDHVGALSGIPLRQLDEGGAQVAARLRV